MWRFKKGCRQYFYLFCQIHLSNWIAEHFLDFIVKYKPNDFWVLLLPWLIMSLPKTTYPRDVKYSAKDLYLHTYSVIPWHIYLYHHFQIAFVLWCVNLKMYNCIFIAWSNCYTSSFHFCISPILVFLTICCIFRKTEIVSKYLLQCHYFSHKQHLVICGIID